jgi:hypothetical protein
MQYIPRVRIARIELAPDAWEAPVLPLNYIRIIYLKKLTKRAQRLAAAD